MNKHTQQSGQVLLIVIMLLATVLTIVLAVAFRATTDTQITKLEEDSQKALAAAEAGIEAALRQGSVADISTLSLGGGITGSAVISNVTSPLFTSPLVQKDEQYTFYLSVPGGTPPEAPDFSTLTPQYTGSITVCFSTANPTSALELTLIKSDYTMKRYAVNHNSSTIITSGETASTPGASDCPSGESFQDKYIISSLDVGANSTVLMVRVFGGATKIGFKGSMNFPLQGKTIVSSANTSTGANKKIDLFQSYPQVPAEFFTTTF